MLRAFVQEKVSRYTLFFIDIHTLLEPNLRSGGSNYTWGLSSSIAAVPIKVRNAFGAAGRRVLDDRLVVADNGLS